MNGQDMVLRAVCVEWSFHCIPSSDLGLPLANPREYEVGVVSRIGCPVVGIPAFLQEKE